LSADLLHHDKHHKRCAVDRDNYSVSLYPGVLPMLEFFHRNGIKVAAASRTHTIDRAEALLDCLEMQHFFHIKQIYPGKKVKHFTHFHEATGIAYKDMLFFDDEERNVRDISQLGVTR
jgi:magnesium-dependent phosphatase 1